MIKRTRPEARLFDAAPRIFCKAGDEFGINVTNLYLLNPSGKPVVGVLVKICSQMPRKEAVVGRGTSITGCLKILNTSREYDAQDDGTRVSVEEAIHSENSAAGWALLGRCEICNVELR